ncbi:MAG TPA: toxin-antitoxin system antitoxin subunit [Actinomycetales bacterium]|nr:toxin-antitoxin system antitoxin subunit [Actinomycetales bacterium]
MSTLTVRKVDPRTHALLRERAARNGRSVEAEIRLILDAAVAPGEPSILHALRADVVEFGGVELEIPARTEQPREVDLG